MEFVALGVGAVVFCEIATVETLEGQFKADVTTKLYVPGRLTEGVAVLDPEVIPGPDQAYVPPPEPDNVIVLFEQVNVLVAPADTVGVGLIVKVIASVANEHGPVGSSVLIVNTTFPAVISEADGV